ncbi:MAG: carbohydrate kinase family protein [Oscillospiraceae bacterium]|jgi:sugar/nucleoside kinase (ribokinase family)
MEYISCGNIMSDMVVESVDNSDPNEIMKNTRLSIGGPALYALSGIRLWTKDCKLVSNTGADYVDDYKPWMDRNGLSCESIHPLQEHVIVHELSYDRADGGYNFASRYGAEHLGYLKTRPSDIDKAAEGGRVKGMYMAQDCDLVWWKQFAGVKAKHGFKMMWEIEYNPKSSKTPKLDKILECMQYADMFSFNHNEASLIFGIPREDDEAIINEIMKFPVELTLYRVGKRGSYAVTPDGAWFCPAIDPHGPSVDPTGCGNNSTGAAMYAHVSGHDPLMTAVMANVASGYNAMQYGPYPEYTDAVMKEAAELADSTYKKLAADK